MQIGKRRQLGKGNGEVLRGEELGREEQSACEEGRGEAMVGEGVSAEGDPALPPLPSCLAVDLFSGSSLRDITWVWQKLLLTFCLLIVNLPTKSLNGPSKDAVPRSR